MVIVYKKRLKNKEYYYLSHSYREENKILKKELFLGKTIPKNIEKIKTDFFIEFFQEKYESKLKSIKANFNKELKSMTKSEREKYTNYFMIKFTYDSNRIEGSTLSLKETAKILDMQISPKNKPISDIKETEAHKKVFYEMLNHEQDLTLDTIFNWHKSLFENTKSDIAGKNRTHTVGIAGSKVKFPPDPKLNKLLKEFIKWYNSSKKTLHPLLLAFLSHLKFVSIHPFADGNGRISRIMMNFILNKHNYPMLNIKYSNRDSYYNSLERAQLTNNDYFFLNHMIPRYIREYKKYIK